MKLTHEHLRAAVRDVIDFPKEGIVFKDLTTVFKQPDYLRFMVDEIYQLYQDVPITKVVGIESRGFILGTALAYVFEAGFVPIRKKGKLPSKTNSKEYSLEYGTDCIEIHQDAIEENDVVLLHDDLLATGGTASAAVDLICQCPVQALHCNFIIELDFLKGREKLNGQKVTSLIHY